MKFVAFLRGINVSGHKIIKMTELTKMFEEMKFKNVKTYIASGNVLFESNEKDIKKLEVKIEKQILKTFGFEVIVFIRTREELEKIVKTFGVPKQEHRNEGSLPPKFYVLFMKEKFSKLKLPFLSKKYAVEVIAALDNNFFCVARPDVVGSGGGANLFIEKEHKIPATTRNWNTVLKIMNLE